MDPRPLLLQLQVELPRHNPIIVVSIIIAVVIALGVLLFTAGRRAAGGTRTTGTGHVYSRGRFKRTAQALGLDSTQTRMLERFVLRYRPSAPMSIFTSNQELDILLSRAITEIRKQTAPETAKEANVGAIYRIKQTIERHGGRNQTVQSSSQLRVGQPISITAAGGRRYHSRVTSVLRNVFAAEIPVDDSGNRVRWKKWTAVEVFFAHPGGKGFSFKTKIQGYTSIKGTLSVLLQHSNSVSAAAQRRYRRKPLGRPAYFYAVQIVTVGTGRDAKKQAVPQTKGALGTALDVSAGGCAIKTTFPLSKNSLVKVEFETQRTRQVTVYGKVTNVRKAEPLGGIMHIMFTRVSRKNLNRINSFVYEIG